jgi:hypothetical protein
MQSTKLHLCFEVTERPGEQTRKKTMERRVRFFLLDLAAVGQLRP